MSQIPRTLIGFAHPNIAHLTTNEENELEEGNGMENDEAEMVGEQGGGEEERERAGEEEDELGEPDI